MLYISIGEYFTQNTTPDTVGAHIRLASVRSKFTVKVPRVKVSRERALAIEEKLEVGARQPVDSHMCRCATELSSQ
jgi:hypothetical protein